MAGGLAGTLAEPQVPGRGALTARRKPWEDFPAGAVVRALCLHCPGRGFPSWEAEVLQATCCGLKTPKDKPQTPQNKSNTNPDRPPSAASKGRNREADGQQSVARGSW